VGYICVPVAWRCAGGLPGGWLGHPAKPEGCGAAARDAPMDRLGISKIDPGFARCSLRRGLHWEVWKALAAGSLRFNASR
jgi:hypothetical protein